MKKNNILIILAVVCGVLIIALVGILIYSKKDLTFAFWFSSSPKTPTTTQSNNNTPKVEDLNQEVPDKNVDMTVKTVPPITEKDHVKGKIDAPVQLIVYSDFECPFCSKFVDVLKKIEETYGEKVVIAFRHYPLRSHIDAIPAAIASECAGEQGKFWEMHDRLFANAKINALSIDKYKTDAKELGLDETKFNKCLEAEKYKDVIIASQVAAKEYGVGGTPASFINGEPLPGAVPFEDFVDSTGKNREGMKSVIDRNMK